MAHLGFTFIWHRSFLFVARLIKILKYLTNMKQLTVKGKFMRRLINHSNSFDDFSSPEETADLVDNPCSVFVLFFFLKDIVTTCDGTKKIFRFFF